MKIALALVATILAGCATSPTPPQLATNQIRVDHYSQPDGAMIYMNQQAIGMAPFSSVYTANNLTAVDGSGRITLTAVWPSGAKVTQTFPTNTHQKNMYVVLSRPIDAPRLDIDMANAAQIQARRDAAKAQADAQTNAMWNSLGNSFGNMGSRRFNCTTVGNMTSCN